MVVQAAYTGLSSHLRMKVIVRMVGIVMLLTVATVIER